MPFKTFFKKNIDKLIAQLVTRKLFFTNKDIKTAMKYRKEVVPKLIAMIGPLVNQDKVKYSLENLTALYLLAYLNEKQAFPLVIQLAKRTEKELKVIFSGYSYEDLHTILADTYNSDFKMLVELIEGSNYSPEGRNEGVQAIRILYEEKVITRDFMLNYYRGLFDNKSFASVPLLMGLFVSCLIRAEATELRKQIENSFHKKLVDKDVYTLKEAQQGLEMNPAKTKEILAYLMKVMPDISLPRRGKD